MDISVIIFVLVGFGSIIAGFVIEKGVIGSLFLLAPAVIVFGGTAGAVGLTFPGEILKRLPKIIKVAITPKKIDLSALVAYFKDVSYKTRKNGLLSLEGEISADPNLDPFIKKGLQLVVDGVDPQAVRSILELELESTSERHKKGAAIFAQAGGYAPTLGIIGTVMGLVHILADLSDPNTLGPKIASGFLATLYGLSSANLLFLPLATRLKALDEKEFGEKSLIIEGILYIQEGINPNTIAEKLKGFLSKEELKKFEGMDGKPEV
ncbi:flagellar motor protein MotA [Clostridium carboxidivorans P7]|uniref:MotA/TolQ/ExbB proton channel n=1 Tax=Clostridium carboxidivorans P7 TaxID=536227 RepID=C6PZF0_9CLOT|nr:flagellar motor protein [Clostridium carboxidivorans]AKN33197.1 flagellar motor protein MotA [Clostridium carboxidivorans P7]EET85385.1 MotA/TolQ/ExbB proton channel [Clostridium carboxidivorans P7]EFG86923.1 transporter, MotA/TolQ/ExbB proton channel family protein [Clostridium carboxidivorans P7]